MAKKIKSEETKTLDVQPPSLSPRLAFELQTLALEIKPAKRKKNPRKIKIGLKVCFALLAGGAGLFWSFCLWAQTPQNVKFPHMINFQSVLTDAGGTPLSDGFHNISFRFLNEKGEVFYQENQSLESVGGVVSAMVGSQGDLAPDIFSPDKGRFLGVQVEGGGPETLMEVVSVPFSLIAEQAMQVAPKSISAEAIVPKSITAELLAEDVIGQILSGISPETLPATLVYQDQLTSLKNEYRGQGGGTKIGVETNFIYSRGSTVQNVLKDFDTAIQQRQVNLDRTADSLQTQLNTKATTVYVDDTKTAITSALQPQINTKATIVYVDDSIGAAKTAMQTSLSTSISASDTANETIHQDINDEINAINARPKVVAAGIVTMDYSIRTAALSSAYNTANVSGILPVTVNFQSPIATPYIVQITPFVPSNSVFSPLLIRSTDSNSFVVDQSYNAQSILSSSFHFVVYKVP